MRYCKKDIVEAVHKLTGDTRYEVERLLNANLYVIRTILEEAKVGDTIEIRDFMNFKIVEVVGKQASLPGHKGWVDKHRRLQVRAGKRLRKHFRTYK